MYYSRVFFEWLIYLSMAGLAVVFGFMVWYFIVDIKGKTFW